MSNNFSDDNPIAISDHYKEKLDIDDEELGQDSEEDSEFEGASLKELRESDDFQEAWRKSHQQKQEEIREDKEQDPEELRELASAMENRGGAWKSEAERIREEVEPSEAEKIGREVAKRLDSGYTEELSEAEEAEAAESDEDDYVFIENDNSGTILTDSDSLKAEIRVLDKREDVSIVSDNETMEARISDLEAVKDRIRR